MKKRNSNYYSDKKSGSNVTSNTSNEVTSKTKAKNVTDSTEDNEARTQAEAEARAKAERTAELNSEISSLRDKKEQLLSEYRTKESELSTTKEIYSKNVNLLESISLKKRNKSYVTVSDYIYDEISGTNYDSLVNAYYNVMEAIQEEIGSVDNSISSKELELNSL